MGRRRVTWAFLTALLILTFINHAASAGQDRQAVFTLADGTPVYGEAAVWLHHVVQDFSARLPHVRFGRASDAQAILWPHWALPDMPPRFHLVGFLIHDGDHPFVKVFWAAPTTREWVDLTLALHSISLVGYSVVPYCDDETEVAGQKLRDVLPWAQHRCMVGLMDPDGLRAYFWMANVPQEDAGRIAQSLYRNLLAAGEE